MYSYAIQSHISALIRGLLPGAEGRNIIGDFEVANLMLYIYK